MLSKQALKRVEQEKRKLYSETPVKEALIGERISNLVGRMHQLESELDKVEF